MSCARVAAARFFPICLLVFSVMSMSGCGWNRPNPSWQIPAAPTLGSEEVVFYATDREPTKPAEQCKSGESPTTQRMYGNTAATGGLLRYGEYAVQLPPLSRVGELAEYRRRPQCVSSERDPIFLRGPVEQNEQQFFATLRDAASRHGKHVVIYIHGYNFEFDEAVLWTAELERYLESDAPVVVFSWPSRGQALSYREDEVVVQNSTAGLEAFLKHLRGELGDMPIDLLAHSLGGRLLLQALESMVRAHTAGPLFRNLVLAAPDVSSKEFVDQIARVSSLAQRSTLYVSSVDRALFASQRLHHDFRAGRDLILVTGVDTVDVSPVDDSRTRHSYYIENRWVLNDLHQLLHDDSPPARRFGLVQLRAGDTIFWQLRP